MSRLIVNLEAEGYVKREQDPNDARGQLVSATEKGRETVDTTRQARAGAFASRFATLNAEQKQKIFDALPALEAIIEFDELQDLGKPPR